MNTIPEIRNILRSCIRKAGQFNSFCHYRAISSQTGDINEPKESQQTKPKKKAKKKTDGQKLEVQKPSDEKPLVENTTAPRDPLRVYLKKDVQNILTRITHIEPAKYAYLRTARKAGIPKVKLMGERNLAALRKKTLQNIYRQVIENRPPVMNPRGHGDRILAENPELASVIDHKYVFLDISKNYTFGDEKWIVIREKSGELRTATHDERDRVMQMFYPLEGRRIQIPEMFKGESFLEMLERGKHSYLLERACVQFEPDDPFYVELTSKVYNHVNDTRQYDLLKHTRHYAPMVFYLAWNDKIEVLLADLMTKGNLLDAEDFVKLYYIVWDKKLTSKLTGVKAVVAYYKFFCPERNKKMLEQSIQYYLDKYRDKPPTANMENRKLLNEMLKCAGEPRTDPVYDKPGKMW